MKGKIQEKDEDGNSHHHYPQCLIHSVEIGPDHIIS